MRDQIYCLSAADTDINQTATHFAIKDITHIFQRNYFSEVMDFDGNVFDFHEDNYVLSKTGEPRISEEENKYEKMKAKMGFVWWSLQKTQSGVWVILDGREIEKFIEEKGKKVLCGAVKEIKLISHKLIQVVLTHNEIVLGLYHFKKEATDFGKSLPDPIFNSKAFLDRLHFEISKEKKNQETELNECRTEYEYTAEDVSGTDSDDAESEGISKESEGHNIDQNESPENEFIKQASSKLLGEFNIDVRKLKFAADDNAIRCIDKSHVNQLIKSLEISYLNGDPVKTPVAVGIVPENTGTKSITDGTEFVEIIDGNHSLFAVKELNEKYKDAECFKTRRVAVYANLNKTEIYTMALLANEKAGQVKHTTPFEKMEIMRRELNTRFGGNFSSNFQNHIYKVFNAVCPHDRKEQDRRRKNLQQLIRLSTIDESCWKRLQRLQEMIPGHSVYVYRELSKLSVSQANTLLDKVLSKELKLQDIRKAALKEVTYNTDDLAVKRIRKKVTRNRQDKNTSASRTNVDKLNAGTTNQHNIGIEKYAEECKLYQRNCEKLEEENMILKDKNLKTERDTKTLQKELLNLKSEKSNMERTIMKLKEDTVALQNVIDSLKVQNQRLSEDKDLLAAENVSLGERLVTIQNQFELPAKGSADKGVHKDTDIRITYKPEKEKRSVKRPGNMNQYICEMPKQKKIVPQAYPSEEDLLPFPLYTPMETIVPDETADEQQFEQLVNVVDWNNKIYLTIATEGKTQEFCKRPLGQIKDGQFVLTEKKESFTVNRKDVQNVDSTYIISTYKCTIKGDHVQLQENCIQDILLQIKQYLDPECSP